MKLTVIGEKDIEIIYLFEVKELEQMHVQEEDRKKLLQVRKNNFILIWHKQFENQILKKIKIKCYVLVYFEQKN